jgi:hypothetical protein
LVDELDRAGSFLKERVRARVSVIGEVQFHQDVVLTSSASVAARVVAEDSAKRTGCREAV